MIKYSKLSPKFRYFHKIMTTNNNLNNTKLIPSLKANFDFDKKANLFILVANTN